MSARFLDVEGDWDEENEEYGLLRSRDPLALPPSPPRSSFPPLLSRDRRRDPAPVPRAAVAVSSHNRVRFDDHDDDDYEEEGRGGRQRQKQKGRRRNDDGGESADGDDEEEMEFEDIQEPLPPPIPLQQQYRMPGLWVRYIWSRAQYDDAKEVHLNACVVDAETASRTETRRLINEEEEDMRRIDTAVAKVMMAAARNNRNLVPRSLKEVSVEAMRELKRAEILLEQKKTRMAEHTRLLAREALSTELIDASLMQIRDLTVTKAQEESAAISSEAVVPIPASMRPERQELRLRTEANMAIHRERQASIARRSKAETARATSERASAPGAIDASTEAFRLLQEYCGRGSVSTSGVRAHTAHTSTTTPTSAVGLFAEYGPGPGTTVVLEPNVFDDDLLPSVPTVLPVPAPSLLHG